MKDLRTSTPSTRPHHLSPLISNSGTSPDSFSVPPTKTPPPTPNICPLSSFAVSGCFSCPSSSRVGRRLPRSSMETLVMLCKQTDSFIKIILLLMYNFYILWRHFSTVFSYFISTLLYFFFLLSVSYIPLKRFTLTLSYLIFNPSKLEQERGGKSYCL